jgi:hypothetical protein
MKNKQTAARSGDQIVYTVVEHDRSQQTTEGAFWTREEAEHFADRETGDWEVVPVVVNVEALKTEALESLSIMHRLALGI